MMNFSKMINRYIAANKKKFNIYQKKLQSEKVDMENGGIIVPTYEFKEIEGVLTRKKTKILYENGGFGYEEHDRLTCYYEMNKGDIILVNDKEYVVIEKIDYSAYDSSKKDGLFIYIISGDNIV